MTESSDEITLFLEHLSWLIVEADLAGNSLLQILSQRFEGGFPFREAIYVDHPAIVASEEATVRLLSRKHKHKQPVLIWGEEPGREVDWFRTVLERGNRGPGHYANIESEELLDRAVSDGLIGLALRWHQILTASVMNDNRKRRRDALVAAVHGTQFRGTPWNATLSRRLRRLAPLELLAIEGGLSLWANLRGEELATHFSRLVRENPMITPQNANDLLEWTAALATARAASLNGWKLDRSALELGGGRDIFFSYGDFRCRISKGLLRDGAGQSIGGASGDDELSELIKATGLKARGIQPDLIVTFWRRDHPAEFVTFLGDAKRNASGEGFGYLASSIAKSFLYTNTYSSFLPLAPQFTLFMFQGVQEVLGIDGALSGDIASAIPISASIPKVFALDMRHWARRSDVMVAWFQHLHTSAMQRLFSSEAVSDIA